MLLHPSSIPSFHREPGPERVGSFPGLLSTDRAKPDISVSQPSAHGAKATEAPRLLGREAGATAPDSQVTARTPAPGGAPPTPLPSWRPVPPFLQMCHKTARCPISQDQGACPVIRLNGEGNSRAPCFCLASSLISEDTVLLPCQLPPVHGGQRENQTTRKVTDEPQEGRNRAQGQTGSLADARPAPTLPPAFPFQGPEPLGVNRAGLDPNPRG